MAANLLTEPYPVTWAKWHLYRKRRRHEHYRTMLEFRRYLRSCQPGGLFIDCGANVGNVTAVVVRKGLVVHAFEPDPVAARELATRFGANPLVTIHNQAVGASARIATLYRPATDEIHHTVGSSFTHRREYHGRTTEVEVIDLFAFMRSLGRRVDLLKLDVEGAEAEILERFLNDGIWRQVTQTFVEDHASFSDDLARRLAAIRERLDRDGIANVRFGWI